MSLYLYELVTTAGQAAQVIKDVDARTAEAGGELIETQVTAGGERVFAITEFESCRAPELAADALGVASVEGPSEVRLVGAELAQIKAARPEAGYLVEWDLPAELDMDSYLARKKANAPKYANVPEVAFLRTYVREDMGKCLCFYDAPDEAAVFRAREAVSTPVDRIHALEG
ncbi:DUF4242 domain-containing protein [Rhodococcus sp. X156]|uniref:DUF4242 domain-containing protein n=1 Tax=Rhodococcus sp. X156 TaxID=2499145 RepID=UPI000FD82486|nr:DUF4242 domain-containing protein [Rhodococcus sp. X156]